jgi:excisionase family DNA binding protein
MSTKALALDQYLTVPQAVRYSQLSESTIKRAIRCGRLRVQRPGARCCLIERASLDELLAERRASTK